jgi:hypothetical protein
MCKSSVVKVDGSILIVYVCCEDCGRWEMFENAGLGDLFDVDVVDRARFSCRMCAVDRRCATNETLLQQISQIQDEFRKQVDELTIRDCSSCTDKIEELRGSIVSIEQRIVNIDCDWPKLGSLATVSSEDSCSSSEMVEEDKFKAVLNKKSQRTIKAELKKKNEIRYFEHSQTVSKVSNSQTESKAVSRDSRLVSSEVSRSSQNEVESFAEKSKNRKGQYVVLGDSMVRGIVSKLARDNDIFVGRSIGGARIEDLNRRILSNEIVVSDKNVVLCVGTNNLISDGTEVIMRKYREFFETLRSKNCKAVSFAGIFYREDVGYYTHCKRLSINLRLVELCREFGFNYICPRSIASEISKTVGRTVCDVESRILNKSRLHFNEWGQGRIARLIFSHCIKNLN